MKKSFLLWIGQNATTGRPNRLTGHYSNYGRFVKFNSISERSAFVDQWRSNNPSEFCKIVNRKTARQYCLGMSVRDYNEYIEYGVLDYLFCESSQRWEVI